MTFGWTAKRGVPDELVDRWPDRALGSKQVLRGLLKYVRSTRQGRRDLIAAGQHLAAFEDPVTVMWSTEDRVTLRAEGPQAGGVLSRRAAGDGRQRYVLIPLDQPERLTELIGEHLVRGSGHTGTTP